MTSDTQLDIANLDGLGGNYWDHARREYLAGVKATSICQRYGMSLSTFRVHARAGKWRRIDQPIADVLPELGEFHPDDDVSFADLADQAFLNIRRALGMGRASEAATWMRLYDKLADRARPDVMADLPHLAPPRLESSREPLRLVEEGDENGNDMNDVGEGLEPDTQEMHAMPPVFSECSSVSSPSPLGDGEVAASPCEQTEGATGFRR